MLSPSPRPAPLGLGHPLTGPGCFRDGGLSARLPEQRGCRIPYVDEIFLQDSPFNPNGLYYQRSLISFADRVRTPTLNVAGGHDLACPPSQAQEFHQALLENGTRSELVIYPEEGHRVRKVPAAMDLTTRIVGWFQEHMPAGPSEPRG